MGVKVKTKGTTWQLWVSGIVLGLVVLGMAIAAWLAIRRRVISNMRSMHFSEITAKTVDMGKQVQWVRSVARNGSLPSRRVDHSSVGAPLMEDNLIAISRAGSMYESVYRRLPVSFGELEDSGFRGVGE
jgi:hypothetical protein